MKALRSTAILTVLVGSLFTAETIFSQTTHPVQASELVGSWRQVSATNGGKALQRAEGVTMHWHVTPTQFVQMGITKENVAGLVTGGSYTFTGDELRETIEYTSDDAKKIKGRSFVYHCKLDGPRLLLSATFKDPQGGDVSVEEVWERDGAK